MPVVATKQSFFEQLTQSIYLDRVLKILGVIVFALAFLASWHGIPVIYRVLMVAAIVMWFVGARFSKIYR